MIVLSLKMIGNRFLTSTKKHIIWVKNRRDELMVKIKDINSILYYVLKDINSILNAFLSLKTAFITIRIYIELNVNVYPCIIINLLIKSLCHSKKYLLLWLQTDFFMLSTNRFSIILWLNLLKVLCVFDEDTDSAPVKHVSLHGSECNNIATFMQREAKNAWRRVS